MRLFTISSYGDEFLTGNAADGRRVLMGLLLPDFVAVFFDRNGCMLGSETRSLTSLPPRMGVTSASWEDESGQHFVEGIQPGPYQIYDPAFLASFAADLDQFNSLSAHLVSILSEFPGGRQVIVRSLWA